MINKRRLYVSLWQVLSVCLILVGLYGWFQPTSVVAQAEVRHITSDMQVEGNIATSSQDILVEGSVLGDVTSLSGDIVIAGYVQGDVVSYSGTIELQGSAQVDGNVLALGAKVTQIAGAQVAGQVIGDNPDEGGALASLSGFLNGLSAGQVGGVSRLSVSLVLALLTAGLVLVVVWRWPYRTEGAGRVMLTMPAYALLMGLLTFLLLVAVFVALSMVLALTLIGLPLVLVLVLVLQLSAIPGLAVLSSVVGRSLVGRGRSDQILLITLVGVLVLLIPLTFLSSMSLIWGMIVLYVLASPGLGAVIISRGGAYLPLPRHAVHDAELM